MLKRNLLAALMLMMLPTLSSASTRPLVTVSLGTDYANVNSSKIITLISPFQNTYSGTSHYDLGFTGGLFLGAETGFLNDWALQYGLSYFTSESFSSRGHVLQFSNPNYENFKYQYSIKSQRLLLDTKLSHTLKIKWHPYLSAAAGIAFNNANNYYETPITTDAVPMTQYFAGNKTNSFTYALGLGVDYDMTEHMRLGIAYRYLDLGSASLGVSPLQSSNSTLSNTHIHANEILTQLSYLA